MLSLTNGTILVATSPSVQGQSTYDGLESKYTGLIAITPTGTQSAFSTRQGLMCTPVSVAQDNSGNIFVADQTAFGRGAGGILQVNSASGAETVVAAQGSIQTYLFGPAGMVYLNGYLYVICSGSAGWGITNTSPRPPDLVRIDPHGVAATGENQTLVYGPGGGANNYSPGSNDFRNPTGITTDGGSHIYVVDAGASGRVLEPDAPPTIWEFTADSNGNFVGQAPSRLTSGNSLNDPVGIVMGTNGNLIVLNQDGTLIQVTPSGAQSVYSASPLPSGMKAESLTVDNTMGSTRGTIYSDAIDSTSTTGAVTVWSVSPMTTSPVPLSVPSNYLSLAAGMLVGNDGSLYIATSPAATMTRGQTAILSQPGSTAFPTGVIHMTVNSGALNIADTAMTRAPGLFCGPQDVVEDSQGNLYVADESALEQGAIIKVEPSGQATLLAWGQNLNGPTGITLVNNELYVMNTGDSSAVVHRLVQVDPNTGDQSDVNDLPLPSPNSSGGSLKVLSGIAPHYNKGVLDPDHILVLDQGGNVGDADVFGQVYMATVTSTSPSTIIFGHDFPTSQQSQPHPEEQGRPDALAMDPLTGTCYAGTEGDSGFQGAVVQVPPLGTIPSDALTTISHYDMNDPNDNNFAGTDGVTVGIGPYGPSTIFVDTLGVPGIPPKITAINPNGNTSASPIGAAQTVLTAGSLLSLVTGLKDYQDPTQVNLVNFETNYGDILNPDDPTQQTNMQKDLADETANSTGAAIVNSPALDGHFSLLLSRSNSVANAEIRLPDKISYYNLPTASYSFLFQYGAVSGGGYGGEGGIVNFQDTSGNYKGAIHLSQNGNLVVYGADGSVVPNGTGTYTLQPNTPYTISAKDKRINNLANTLRLSVV
ncbi:MAG TPA: hypothetical protein VKU02_27270 [Gemmataceae bacterium]|nr:hypothetical protein [Gemmataceae bacterium]